MKQHYEQYSETDFFVWKTLFERQVSNLDGKACSLYLDCLNDLKPYLNADMIPRFTDLSAALEKQTGWTLEVVPGLIPVDQFFGLMEKRKFCSSTWLRRFEQLDYLEEPDMFHDIFGHIPLLWNKDYADLMQKIGALGTKYSQFSNVLDALERFYWFTIEFGLIKEAGERRIYGAGVLSSFGESKHIYSDELTVLDFDLKAILQKSFIKSDIQGLYYELSSFNDLHNALANLEVIIQQNEELAIGLQ